MNSVWVVMFKTEPDDLLHSIWKDQPSAQKEADIQSTFLGKAKSFYIEERPVLFRKVAP